MKQFNISLFSGAGYSTRKVEASLVSGLPFGLAGFAFKEKNCWHITELSTGAFIYCAPKGMSRKYAVEVAIKKCQDAGQEKIAQLIKSKMAIIKVKAN